MTGATTTLLGPELPVTLLANGAGAGRFDPLPPSHILGFSPMQKIDSLCMRPNVAAESASVQVKNMESTRSLRINSK